MEKHTVEGWEVDCTFEHCIGVLMALQYLHMLDKLGDDIVRIESHAWRLVSVDKVGGNLHCIA